MLTNDELAAQIAALAADLGVTRTQVPTFEELPPTSIRFDKTITGALRLNLLAANRPLCVLGAALGFDYYDLAASDSSYWTFILEHGNDVSGFPDIATRSTQNTGSNANGPIQQRTPWVFDAAAWFNPVVAAGEVLTLNCFPTGGPSSLDFRGVVTVWTRPL